MLVHFLDFRLRVTRARFQHELRELLRRIHILEGFRKIFDALDETIKIIRASEGKDDAAGKLMKRFGLDEIQVDAILELKLYKLARLEILMIREELEAKSKEAARITAILASEKKLWGVIKSELAEVGEKWADKRRTKVGGAADETEFSEEHFIIAEDVTRIAPGHIRSMQNPVTNGLPDHYSLRQFVGSEIDGGGIHINCTIVTHAFYLAVAGGINRVSGMHVQGIGTANIADMERIFYRAFVFSLGPLSQFSDARAATLQAAAELFGMSSPQRLELERAWTAVGVM